MGLLSTGQVFTQEWIDGLKAIPTQFMTATLKIALPQARAIYDPATNSYNVPPETVVYTGSARVTARRAALQQPLRENPTITQAVQFQIPIEGNDFDLRNNFSVTVQDSPLNPWLLKYAYRVHEFVDSSNPIERTFWCIVDQEVVYPNG